MVLGFQALSSGLSSAFDADAPLIVSKNILTDALTGAVNKPRWTTSGSHSDTDTSDTDAPATHAFNGRPDIGTFSTDQTSNAYYWTCQFAALQKCDCVIYKPNRRIQYGTVTVEAAGTGDPTFASSITLASFGAIGVTDTRQIDLTLNGGNNEAIDIEYIRIGFTLGSNYGVTPRIGELHIGSRRQVSRKMNRPVDTQMLASGYSEFQARSRTVSRHIEYKGARDYRGTWTPSGGNKDQFGLDDLATLRSMWEECEYGTGLVAYCEDPSTSPGELRLGLLNMKERRYQEVDFAESTVDFEFFEVPQFKTAET